MAKLLSFKDMYTVEYRPGEDELINYRAYRRKRLSESTLEESTIDEFLTTQQRMAKARLFRKIQPKIKIGRERAKRKIASKEKLQKRAMKMAREQLRKKLTKEIPKSELSFAKRQEIEKRLGTPVMKKRIKALARKLLPGIRRAELAKKRGTFRETKRWN